MESFLYRNGSNKRVTPSRSLSGTLRLSTSSLVTCLAPCNLDWTIFLQRPLAGKGTSSIPVEFKIEPEAAGVPVAGAGLVRPHWPSTNMSLEWSNGRRNASQILQLTRAASALPPHRARGPVNKGQVAALMPAATISTRTLRKAAKIQRGTNDIAKEKR